jgi:putative colanic acid biosynthesis UDP-glucose lipid carrier transferase
MDLHVNPRSESSIKLSRSRRILKNHENFTFWVQLAADVFVVTAVLYLLTFSKTGGFDTHYRFLAVIVALSMCGIYTTRGIYRQAMSHVKNVARLTLAWLLCLTAVLLVGFVTKTTDLFSRQVLLVWAPLALSLQVVNHIAIGMVIKQYKESFGKHLRAVVIGEGNTARHLIKSLNGNRWLPDYVVGVVRGDSETPDIAAAATLPVPVIGHMAGVRQVIREHGIRRVYIALPMEHSEQIQGLHFDLLDMNVDVIWAPDISAMRLLNHSVREVSGTPIICLNESPLTSSRVATKMKSLMDRVVAACALLALSPLLISVAIAVKRSSPGPVFFKQDRTGFDGKVFKVWKFRSMKMHADEKVVQQATKEDPRITKVGKFIRRTSIDELPQLFNVLDGTMSLVGPRPHAVSHNNYYSDKINSYLARHRIKPGITGLAQISGYRGETETLDKMEKRVELDLEYINNWTIILDINILIRTPYSLLSKDIY